DDNADLARRRGRANRFEIFDRAIHEAAGAIASRHGWDEGVGARCEHELVVFELASSRGRDALRAAVDRFGLLVEMKRDGVAIEETLFDEREVLCGLAGKERRQPDAVIGRARLFAEHGDIEVVRFTGHIFQQALADHAVPDDDEFASHAVCCLQGVTASAPRGGASASARALSASSYRRRSSSFCSRVNRTASAQTAVAATIAPSRNNAYWIVPVPFTRKPAATAPTLPPAPTMPATPPSALRLMKGTRLYVDPQAMCVNSPKISKATRAEPAVGICENAIRPTPSARINTNSSVTRASRPRRCARRSEAMPPSARAKSARRPKQPTYTPAVVSDSEK